MIPLHRWRRTQLDYYIEKVLCDYLGRITSTAISQGYTIHNSYGSWLTQKDFKSIGQFRPLARWQARSSKFSFVVVKHAGMKHREADAFSRLPTKWAYRTLLGGLLLLLRKETLPSTDTVIYFVDSIDAATCSLDAMNKPSCTPHGNVPWAVPVGGMFKVSAVTADTQATPTNVESIRHRTKKAYFCAAKLQVVQPNTKFPIDLHKLLVGQSTIDGAIRVAVSTLLRQHLLALAHNLPKARITRAAPIVWHARDPKFFSYIQRTTSTLL